jgi:hypothetical protein
LDLLHLFRRLSQGLSVELITLHNPKTSKLCTKITNCQTEQNPIRGFSGKRMTKFNVRTQGLQREHCGWALHSQNKRAMATIVGIQGLQLKHHHIPWRLADIEGHNNMLLLPRLARTPLQH